MQLASVPSRRWNLEPSYVLRMVPIRCHRYNISLFLYSRQWGGSQLSVPTCCAKIYPIIRFAWDACWHIEPMPPINENTGKKLPYLCAVMRRSRLGDIYIPQHTFARCSILKSSTPVKCHFGIQKRSFFLLGVFHKVPPFIIMEAWVSKNCMSQNTVVAICKIET
jgi:hypothetical protein